MRVFLSWSGWRSKKIASFLRGTSTHEDGWLQQILDGLDPWMSSEDIDAGTGGMSEIKRNSKGPKSAFYA